MKLPVNIMMWSLALLPILILLVLMIKFQLAASKAALIGLIIAIINSIIFFKAGAVVIGIELLKALWNTLTIIIIIFTAILMYEVTNEAKAFSVLKNCLKRIAPNELLRIIGIGVVFASFLQGITGFGVPVVVTSPLLIAVGVKPIWSVIIPLLGHSWAGTFGTLAIAWLSLVMQTGITDTVLLKQAAMFAAGFMWILNFTAITAICWFYGGNKAVKKGFLAIVVISITQGGGQLLFSQVNPVFACFIPSCIAFVAFALLSKSKYYKSDWKITHSIIMRRSANQKEVVSDTRGEMNIHEAFLPYYVMTLITLLVLLTPAINNFLGQWSIAPTFDETKTGYGVINSRVEFYSPIKPFTNAGTFLFISALCGFIYYLKKGYISNNSGKAILSRALKKTLPSSMAVISLIMMSRVMEGTGQTTVLAVGTSQILGPYYSIIAPFIGLLGSFMTGSNMSSNIIFGNFQLTTAKVLNLKASTLLGVHTAGGAVGTSISPGNIVLGTTSAEISGEEGNVLKKILPIDLALALAFGLILYIYQTIL